MSKFHVLVHSLLLVTSPSLLAYPQCEQSILSQVYNAEKPFEDIPLTYDDILKLLQDIEEEKMEEVSEEKIERITQFIAFLAQKGMLPDNYAANVELEHDIAALFQGKDDFFDYARDYDYAYVSNFSYEYIAAATLLNSDEDARTSFCKSKSQKKKEKERKKKEAKPAFPTVTQFKTIYESHLNVSREELAKAGFKQHHNEHAKNLLTKIKDFIVKHKKAIIIGAIVVVAATVIIVAVIAGSSATAATTAAAAAEAAAKAAADHKRDIREERERVSSHATPSEMASGVTDLKSTLDYQIASFKENLVQKQFFLPTNPSIGQQGLSWEETGRTLGSLFAHDSYNAFSNYSTQMQEFHSNYPFPISGKDQSSVIGHSEIDRKFSTDYSYLYSNPSQERDFNTLSYQMRGERALSMGYYDQAVQDLGKAIETNPTNPVSYLERGIAHFGLGQYDRSLEDYKQFASQAPKSNSLSISEFSLGFAKGLPKGVYESGEGFLLFMADFVTHPIQTSRQMVDSVTTLVNLVRNDEWGVIAEVLSPEVRQLVTQWDTLSSEKKGELAGYAVGKHGADILAPGALAKVASKSVKSAQELALVCKNFQIAQETLVLETAAGIGNSAKIAEVVEAGQRITRIADELGFTTQEMGPLKQAGQLESTVTNKLEHLSLPMQESFALHTKAKEALKPYLKKPLPEFKVRELIHETGIPTFARPKGIPENYIVTVSDKGAGMKYIHPQNEHTYIRVMPGKPHSSYPYQQKPYVNQRINGQSLDKYGKIVRNDSPEAHILMEEFVYRGTE